MKVIHKATVGYYLAYVPALFHFKRTRCRVEKPFRQLLLLRMSYSTHFNPKVLGSVEIQRRARRIG